MSASLFMYADGSRAEKTKQKQTPWCWNVHTCMYAPTLPVTTADANHSSLNVSSVWASLFPCYGSNAPAIRVVQHDDRPISVAELSTHLEAGDLLFMCGNTLVAWLIEKFGRTRFSHVCMVDTTDVFNDFTGAFERREHYLWESVYHADQCRCVIQRRVTNGVRLTQYEDRMMALFNEYASNVSTVCVAVVKLENCSIPPSDPSYAAFQAQWRQEMARRMHEFQIKFSGRPYQVDVAALLQSRYRWLFGRAPREDASVFCTELVMLTYKAMGLLPDNVDTNVSLTALSYDSHRLHMLDGVRLAPRIDYYNVMRPAHIAHAYHQPPSQPPLPPPLSQLLPPLLPPSPPLPQQQQQYYYHHHVDDNATATTATATTTDAAEEYSMILSSSPTSSLSPPVPAELLASIIHSAIAATSASAFSDSTSTSTSTSSSSSQPQQTSTIVRVKKLHLT